MKNHCKDINRRLFVLGGIGILSGTALWFRFFKFQCLDYAKYSQLSDQNRIRTVIIHNHRRVILDCHNREIAFNRRSYSVICDPTLVRDKNHLVEKLQSILGLQPQELEVLLQRLNGNSVFTVKKNVVWQEISLLEFNANQLEGINITEEYLRIYPYASIMSHVIGYTMYDSKEKKYIGVSGLERLYESVIQDDKDVILREVDHRERLIREISRSKNESIKSIQVSLSSEMHFFIYRLLKKYVGSVCLIDMPSGRVRALVNSPSYDNNLFSRSLSHENWVALSKDERKPLLNRALSSAIQPASSFKPIVALAALQDGIIKPDTFHNCRGSIKIGNRRFYCWKKSGHGMMNLQDALAESCNIYFYEIGKKIEVETLLQVATEFGFGRQIFTNMKEERCGIIPDLIWRKKYLENGLNRGDIINLCIGHGYLGATPLQLAIMASRLGTAIKIDPTFSISQVYEYPALNVHIEHLTLIQNALKETLRNRGTASSMSRFYGAISGKTGTAQVGHNIKTVFSRNSVFIGYTNKQVGNNYAISAVLYDPPSGSAAYKIAIPILDRALSVFNR